MKKFYLIIAFLLFLTGCSTRNQGNIDTNNEHIHTNVYPLEANGFEVYAPAGWKYTPKMGIDSIIGELSGDGMTLTFIYGNNVGFFSQNSQFNESDYNVTRETINGAEAIIYTSRINDKGSTVLDIKNPPLDDAHKSFGGKFNIFGENLSEEQKIIALQIFHTIHFK